MGKTLINRLHSPQVRILITEARKVVEKKLGKLIADHSEDGAVVCKGPDGTLYTTPFETSHFLSELTLIRQVVEELDAIQTLTKSTSTTELIQEKQ